MVAVAADHVLDIGHGPLLENLGVTEPAGQARVPAADPFVLGRRKFVKRFVHDQQAQPVAEVQQFRRRRIYGWCGQH